jgi:hypothetical protein
VVAGRPATLRRVLIAGRGWYEEAVLDIRLTASQKIVARTGIEASFQQVELDLMA